MKVREIMTTDVECAAPDSTLEEIATMMKEENVGAIPVVDEEELCGIITDRDIVVRCIAEGKDPAECTADEILSEELQTVGPDANVEQALRMMAQRQIRRLPVVEDGRLVGVISIGDVAVKQGDEEEVGETLEEVSQGVKQSSRRPQRKAEPTRVSGREPAANAMGGRQQQLESQPGRHQAGKEGRNQPAGREQARPSRVVPIRGERHKGREAAGKKRKAS